MSGNDQHDTALTDQLKWWRRHRGVSQLDLALQLDVSARHLSFVENGRSTPSRSLLQRIAAALQLPLRAENLLLTSAGYRPAHPSSTLDDVELAPARAALDRIVDNHAPYPAVVLDLMWNVVTANTAMTSFLGLFMTAEEQEAAGAPNMMRLTYHPDGLRRHISNWDETAFAYIQWLHRDIAQTGDARLRALLDEIAPHAPAQWRSPDFGAATDPYLTITFANGELDASFFTVAATLGSPYDVTLQELRVELFYPADEATTTLMRALAGAGVDPAGLT